MQVNIPEPPLAKFLLGDTRMAWVWLPIRLYVGYEWVNAGLNKVTNAAWTGDKAGMALEGFIKGALAKSAGPRPDVSGWYASFLDGFVTPNAAIFAHVVAWGELAVGAAVNGDPIRNIEALANPKSLEAYRSLVAVAGSDDERDEG